MRVITTLMTTILMWFSHSTFASECELTISATDAMQFDKKRYPPHQVVKRSR